MVLRSILKHGHRYPGLHSDNGIDRQLRQSTKRTHDPQMTNPALTLGAMYRMPTAFGPAPGPRNVPAEKAHLRYAKDIVNLGVVALTDAALLERLLPPRCKLEGEARIQVNVLYLTNVGWLAGRGYNIVMVSIPAVLEGAQEVVRGTFCPVMWESMADPILTGREELGFPKINADIPAATVLDGIWGGCASWESYRFFDIEAGPFERATTIPATGGSMFFHKYMPKTGDWGTAEINCMTVTGAEVPPQVHSVEVGTGRFAFRSARWEDMPTQYPIVNALAALPLEFRTAHLVKSSGGGDVSSQRIVR
jgi:Acetoacetate decarboxylase (ADC)